MIGKREPCGACDGEGNLENGDACPECCDHSDRDAYCCLICGHDMAEDDGARAFDAWKDSNKYGDT